MTLISVDVEADGPCPGLYSMVSFGAVVVADMSETFYGETAPIVEAWVPEALAVSGFTRDQHKLFHDPREVMQKFRLWLKKVSIQRPIFISDNPAFDWQFINYYFHRYLGENPFGYSARRIGDIYCGVQKNGRAAWKHLRKTKHDHNPVNDAKSNAEAILQIAKEVRGLM